MVVFLNIGCIRAKLLYSGKVIVIEQKCLCSGKNGCIRDKWLFFDKVVVFEQSGCIRVQWFYSGKSGCIGAKVVLFGNVVVFG